MKLAAVQISQDVDLEGLLKKLPIELRGKELSRAVNEGTKIVAKAYKARVPKGKTKNLFRSITTKTKVYKDGQLAFGLAGARTKGGKSIGPHAHFIEDGHFVYRRGREGESAKGLKLAPLTGTKRTVGRRDLLKAIDSTKTAQDRAVIASLVKSIKMAGG